MLKKRYYKFTEKLMFAIVMRDKELCRELLERIIPERKIRQIRFPTDPAMDHLAASLKETEPNQNVSLTVEKTIITGLYSKAVRFDVLFEDDNAWYDIEMQVNWEKDLPLRTRYYHASMAVGILDAGQHYSELKPSYVIFICMFDFPGEKEAVYRFQMMEEKKHLPLKDGQFTIIVNMECPEKNVPEELRSFYSFVNRGEVAEGDTFISKIHRRVEQANQSREVFEIMTIADEFRMLEQRKAQLEDEVAQMETETAKLESTVAEMTGEKQKLESTVAEMTGEKQKLESTVAEMTGEKQKLESTVAEMTGEKQKLESTVAQMEREKRLMEFLIQQNRFDDLKKTMEDMEYQEKIMIELNLI